MGELFLSGGGNQRQTRRFDKLFVASLPKGKRMLYIPIAMPEKQYTWGACFDWIRKVMRQHGFTKIDMWTDLKGRSYSELSKYGSVYIGGGNSLDLLNLIRKSGFDKVLKRYFHLGGIIYGSSAGAIAMGHDMTVMFKGKADIKLAGQARFKGLDIAGRYSITCHYKSLDDVTIKDYVKRQGTPVLAIQENAGVHIALGITHVVGNVYLFNRVGKSVLKNKLQARPI
jgi:dipeptidase E